MLWVLIYLSFASYQQRKSTTTYLKFMHVYTAIHNEKTYPLRWINFEAKVGSLVKNLIFRPLKESEKALNFLFWCRGWPFWSIAIFFLSRKFVLPETNRGRPFLSLWISLLSSAMRIYISPPTSKYSKSMCSRSSRRCWEEQSFEEKLKVSR